MSKETRQAHTAKLAMMASIRGHESTVAHAFHHTEGKCPKCGCPQQMMGFCDPNSRERLPQVPGCELDGEHLHRVCSSCKYPWIERCWDQAMLAEERGEMVAESEAAAVLAALTKRVGGVTLPRTMIDQHRGWILRFGRDAERGTVTLTAEEAPPQVGKPAHPQIREGG